MSATIIDGKAIAARVREEVAEGVRAFNAQTGRTPGLATVLVGDDPASAVYVGGKQRACAQAGMQAIRRASAGGLDARAGRAAVARAGGERGCERDAAAAAGARAARRPVADGAGAAGEGRGRADAGERGPAVARDAPGCVSATPLGVLELLRQSEVELEGAEAVVVGRSNLFGKPMAQLLLARDATVTVCHSRTRDLRAVCARADVLIAAVGRPRLIEGVVRQAGRGRDRRRHEPARRPRRPVTKAGSSATSTSPPLWRSPPRSPRCRGAWVR